MMPAYPAHTSVRRVMAMAAMVLAMAFAPGALRAADTEHASSLNGTLYAVIAPIFDGSTGTASYLRLFNGASATTTFSVTIVDADTGATLGSTNISVPKNASPQYPVTLAGGNGDIFDMAGVKDVAGTDYALYIQNASTTAGYQHVTYNNTSKLFENMSVCDGASASGTTLDQQITAVSESLVLTNVQTSALDGGTAYPSIITIHNFYNTELTYRFSVIDAAAGGSAIVQFNVTVPANSTVTLPESQIEAEDGFHPTSSQLQINLIVTDTAGNPPYEMLVHTIQNAALGGSINMTEACAVNPISTSTATTVPTGLNGY